MNKFICIGRLTRDPDIRVSNNGQIANYSIAVDRKYKREGEPSADFFNCTCFGKLAEFADKYLHKGIKIAIEGHVQNETYTNKDGQKVTQTRVYVDSQEFVESKQNGGQASASAPANAQSTSGDGFVNIPTGTEDELPFN